LFEGNFTAGEDSTECGLKNEHTNIRHYWSKDLQDFTDEGIIMVRCTIVKYYSNILY